MIRRAGRALALGRSRSTPVMWARHPCPTCRGIHSDGPDLCKKCQNLKSAAIADARKRAFAPDPSKPLGGRVSILLEATPESGR